MRQANLVAIAAAQRVEQRPLGSAQPAADHDHAGIDHGDGVGQGDGERPDGVVPDLERRRRRRRPASSHDAGRVDGRVGRATAASVAIGDRRGPTDTFSSVTGAPSGSAGSTTLAWPISPAWLVAPMTARPSTSTVAAMPVPMATNSATGWPAAAPNAASARAAARTSCCRATGVVATADSRSAIATSCQPNVTDSTTDPGHLVDDAGHGDPGGDHVEAARPRRGGRAARAWSADVVEHRLAAALALGGDAFEHVQTAAGRAARP